jgi:hypothetical protein
MGMIMVAGAFPVGAHQTQQMIRQTDASMLARSAAELVLARNYIRDLSEEQWDGLNPKPVPIAPYEEWRIWSPDRLAYMEDWRESKLLPPGSGDYIVTPFLTPLMAADDQPYFRMTVVVTRYSSELPDMIDAVIGEGTGKYENPAAGNEEKIPPGIRYVDVGSAIGKKLSGKANAYFTSMVDTDPKDNKPDYVSVDRYLMSGDWVMDPQTGLCYQIGATETNSNGKVTAAYLTDEPFERLPTSGRFYTFRNVVGVFYQLVSQ